MSRTLSYVVDRPLSATIVIAVLIIGLWLSPTHIYEDGMFYLRYAYNLASGYGLVYNPGEYYEGNTAFLWTILLAPAFPLGIEPVFYLRALGGLVAAGVLMLTYQIVATTESRRAGLLAVILLGTHYSFMIIAVSGFAPHLQSFFALLTLLLILRLWEKPGAANAAAVGLGLSALLLTRLDSALFAGILGFVALYVVWRRGGPRRLAVALVCGLPALTFVCFLLWKLYYYGDILPATYYIKAGSQVPEFINFFERGVAYIWVYLRQYWFAYLLPVFLYGAYCRLKSTPPQFSGAGTERRGGATKRKRRQRMPELSSRHIVMLACAAMTILWLMYMPRIGGDRSEFRTLMPLAPLLFILIVAALRGLRGVVGRSLAAATVALLICASFYHQHTYVDSGYLGIAQPSPSRFLTWTPVPRSFNHVGWELSGRALAKLFAEEEDYPEHVKIATTAGGHLPYYSRLYTLEMRGFTDPRILLPGNHVIVENYQAGHQFSATQRLMIELGINLVLNPLMVSSDTDVIEKYGVDWLSRYLRNLHFPPPLPMNTQLVEIPIGGGLKIVGLYLIRNEKLDAILRENNTVVYDFPPHGHPLRQR